MSTKYSVTDRMIELERENMGYWIAVLEERVRLHGKEIAEEADRKLRELKAKGIDLAPD